MTNRDTALFQVLIIWLEPGEGAWSNIEDIETYYFMPHDGDTEQRIARLLPAMKAEYATENDDPDWLLHHASEAELLRHIQGLKDLRVKAKQRSDHVHVPIGRATEDNEDAIKKMRALRQRIEDENPDAHESRIMRLWVEEVLKDPDMARQLLKDMEDYVRRSKQ
jgi:hypothetical protein